MNESSTSKEKRKGYDSDEDENNTLIIEEEDEPMHHEEPNSENDAGLRRTDSETVSELKEFSNKRFFVDFFFFFTFH